MGRPRQGEPRHFCSNTWGHAARWPSLRNLRRSGKDRLPRCLSFKDTYRFARSSSFPTRRPGPRKTPLMGFIRVPSADIDTACPLPLLQSEDHSRFGSRLPTSNMFRPCRSSRPRRLTPRGILQVCCTLQPTMGSTPFQRSVDTEASTALVPESASPFRAFPCPTVLPTSPALCCCQQRPVHRSSYPSRRCRQVSHSRTLLPAHENRGSCSLDLRDLIRRAIRSDPPMLPPTNARCSLGLLVPTTFGSHQSPPKWCLQQPEGTGKGTS
jgi:hypothetical protein